MAAENWDKCSAITLDYEGGNDDDPHDPGGRTSRGITQNEYNLYRKGTRKALPSDVWKAPQDAILDIYRSSYWDEVAGDAWPMGLDLCVYDAGVNSGIGKALAWSQYTLGQSVTQFSVLAGMAGKLNDQVGAIKKFQGKRLSFLEALRTWSYFGKGWARRVAGIEALAIKMVAEQMPESTPETVASTMKAEASKASTKSQTAGGGVVATGTGGSVEASTFDMHNMLDQILLLGVCIATVAVVSFLFHHWYVNNVRAKALTGVAKS